MSNILATNPRLEDLIKKQVKNYGLNHGMISDNRGMIMDNNGNTTDYVGSNGRHPNSKINENSLYEGCGDGEMYEGCGGEHEEGVGHELNEKKRCGVFTQCRWDRIMKELEKAVNDLPWNSMTDPDGEGNTQGNNAMEEATSSGGASGSFVAPLNFDETEEIMERVIRDEVNKLMLENRVKKSIVSEANQSQDTTNYSSYGSVEKAYNFKSQGSSPMYGGDGYNFESKGPLGVSYYEQEEKEINEREELHETYTCWHRKGVRSSGKHSCGRHRCGTGDWNIPRHRNEYGSRFECNGMVAPGTTKGGKASFNSVGSGFKIPQGGSDRLEMFNRRQMNEAEVPGISITKKTLKNAKSQNNSYLKSVDKKIKEYLNFKDNSHPEFPHQNNSKTDYKSPMYRNSQEDTEFIDDFRGMGLQDANGADTLDRIDDYLNGSTRTGNSQDAANAIPSTVGKKMLKNIKRKKDKIAKQKSKMTNLRGMTPDVQTVTNIKESKDIGRMKKLIDHKITGQ